EEDQPEAAREEEARELGVALLSLREPRGGAGEEHEDRRAVVGDEAREEERGRGLVEVGRIERLRAEEIAHVIERHQRHHDAAQEIDGGRGVRRHARIMPTIGPKTREIRRAVEALYDASPWPTSSSSTTIARSVKRSRSSSRTKVIACRRPRTASRPSRRSR